MRQSKKLYLKKKMKLKRKKSISLSTDKSEKYRGKLYRE